MTEKTTIILPEAFEEKMRRLLGEEYGAFVRSYEADRVQGLRFNTLKTGGKNGAKRMTEAFGLKKIPWAQEGFYYDAQSRPGKHALHEAGVYYIQEPSAMAVVELLDPQPGELVLDLCAAPGGKSTHIAQRLQGRGFLLSNEIHPARARILSQNIERMGIGNAVVTNEDSGRLASCFPVFFDKIVVDAPCSGEGMFRKDEGARAEWSPENVAKCAARQREILDNAARMLKGGGRLVYSTCTFSPEENEGSIEGFLDRHPEFSVEAVNACEGFAPGHPEWVPGGRKSLAATFRIWPHKVKGEGHYLAVLRKEGEAEEVRRKRPPYVKEKGILKELRGFADQTLSEELRTRSEKEEVGSLSECAGRSRLQMWEEHLVLFGNQLYVLPAAMIEYKGLKVVRPGLHLGTMKKNRFEPSHALALYLKRTMVNQWYDMESCSPEIARYLNGEVLALPEQGDEAANHERVKSPEVHHRPGEKGWVLMLVDGYSIGWAKLVGNTLKNHYPRGLRKPL